MPLQVLDCIKILQTKSTLPIQRSRMRVRITMPSKDGKRLKEKILESAEKVEQDEFGQNDWELVRYASLSIPWVGPSRNAECCSVMRVCWGNDAPPLDHAHRPRPIQGINGTAQQGSQRWREDGNPHPDSDRRYLGIDITQDRCTDIGGSFAHHRNACMIAHFGPDTIVPLLVMYP